jgi:hypothetical protein
MLDRGRVITGPAPRRASLDYNLFTARVDVRFCTRGPGHRMYVLSLTVIVQTQYLY